MDDLRKEIATALRYKPGTDSAPVVVASGKGLRAKTIKETAKKAGVPIYRDETLARTLHDLGIGAEIPPQLYEAVAKVLVYIAKLDQKHTGSSQKT